MDVSTLSPILQYCSLRQTQEMQQMQETQERRDSEWYEVIRPFLYGPQRDGTLCHNAAQCRVSV